MGQVIFEEKIGGERLMRIDASQILGQGGIKVKAGAGVFADTLKEGDTIRAEVLLNEKGVVTMKTDGGQVFKAKIDAGVALMPGDKVSLEVSGKEKGLLLITAGGMEDPVEEIPSQTGAARGSGDKSLEPYINKLAEMKLPSTAEVARQMRDLIALNPKLSMDEAAFLASNKIAGDSELMRAALALLANGDKTDVMLARLLALLNAAGAGEPGLQDRVVPLSTLQATPPGQNAVAGGTAPDAAPTGPPTPQTPLMAQPLSPLIAQLFGSGAQASTLMDLLMLLAGSPGAAGSAYVQGAQASAPNIEPIIAQSDVIMQSTNVEKTQEFIISDEKNVQLQAYAPKNAPALPSQNALIAELLNQLAAATKGDAPPLSAQIGGDSPSLGGVAQGGGAGPQNLESALQSMNPQLLAQLSQLSAQAGPNTELSTLISQLMSATEQNAPLSTLIAQLSAQGAGSPAQLSAQGAESPAQLSAQGAEINARLTALLSEIPEFRGTPPSALERFSDMLLRVAGESAETKYGAAEKLETLIDKLFTRIDRGDADSGARLREARTELFARLALIEEAISRASPPARAEMLEQTHRLMEHVRVLNSIDQFVYMQLPVQLAEQRRAAELYLFKRKGGRKPDPENVNILLALDLENMGRWESFINIKKKDVLVQMEVRGAAEKEHFSANTVLLHDLLAEAGFKLVNTGITYAEKETTPLSALTSLDRHTTSRAGAIDFWI